MRTGHILLCKTLIFIKQINIKNLLYHDPWYYYIYYYAEINFYIPFILKY